MRFFEKTGKIWEKIHSTQMCMPLKPVFSKYERDGVQITDEPTGNLDRKNGAEIIRLLKESNQNQKQTLLLITHDESIALQADRMISIEDGRITRDERIRMSGGDRR